MQTASGPHPRTAFRDKYLAAFGVVALLLCSILGRAQIIQYPNPGAYGQGMHRFVPDSTLYFPTGCGAPSGIASLNSYGFSGFGQKIRQAAIYADTCGKHVYWFNWADSSWRKLDTVGSGSGTGSADSLKRLFVDTGAVAHNSYYLGFDSVNRKWKLYSVSFYDSAIMQTKYRSDTGRINFYAALSAKLSAVATSNSVQGNGTSGSPVQLAGDQLTPGASRYYGTDGSGAKGYYSLPSGVAPANPTASIAYAPVNGTAPTYMRSDASPGLDTNALNIHTDGFNLSKYKRIGDSSAASGYVTHTALNDSLQSNADTTDYREIGATGIHSFYLTLNPHHTILAIPKMRGLAPIKVAANGTDTVAEFSADTSSANTALATLGQLQKRIDSLGGVTNTAIAGKVANNGASTGIKAGTYASRPAASNCQCYYWSTDSAWYSYDNGSWKDLKPGSGSSGGGSTYVLDSVQTVTSGSTVTIGNGISILVINPSSPISSLAVTLPATPRACGYVKLVYGGTMTTGNTVVSNLTITANTGQTLIRNGTVGTVSAGDQAIVLNNISNTWYNEQ